VFLEVSAAVERQQHGRAHIHLLTLASDDADFLNDLPVMRGGFQSIKVRATVGNTTWLTSLFPTNDTFILLISQKLMKAEQIEVGEVLDVNIQVL